VQVVLPAHSLSRTHYFTAGAGGSVTSRPAPALKHVLERSVPSAAPAGCLADDERWRAYHGNDNGSDAQGKNERQRTNGSRLILLLTPTLLAPPWRKRW
jgi:hypothetical protein